MTLITHWKTADVANVAGRFKPADTANNGRKNTVADRITSPQKTDAIEAVKTNNYGMQLCNQ